jgi:hypothetical protein
MRGKTGSLGKTALEDKQFLEPPRLVSGAQTYCLMLHGVSDAVDVVASRNALPFVTRRVYARIQGIRVIQEAVP